jgi:hypothetical protein
MGERGRRGLYGKEEEEHVAEGLIKRRRERATTAASFRLFPFPLCRQSSPMERRGGQIDGWRRR